MQFDDRNLYTYIPTYLGYIHQMTFNYILRHEQVEVMSEVGQF